MKAEQVAFRQQIIFQDRIHVILSAEQEYIVHPAIFDMVPITSQALNSSFFCSYSIQNYHLYLDTIALETRESLPEENGTSELQNTLVRHTKQPVLYNGAILLGRDPVKEYVFGDNHLPCFSYKYVYELVFNNGILETTVDHSRAMLRIRKNIELKLRSLNSKRDRHCIKHFLNASFIGDYRPLVSPYAEKWFPASYAVRKKRKYLESLKKAYLTLPPEK